MLTLVLYPPGAGGNHLRNIISLGAALANTLDVDYEQFYWNNPEAVIGEVPAQGGRNVHEWIMFDIFSNPTQSWILACHFGEIAAWRAHLQDLDLQAVVISIDRDIDQALLQSRQQRLGQHCHPYWISEEFPWLYQPVMLENYFNISPTKIWSVPMADFWASDIRPVLSDLDLVLNIQVYRDRSQQLHDRWREINLLTNN